MSKIYINPGHGGADSGAVGTGGRREKDDVLRLATAVSHILASSGHDVRMYRDGDYLLELSEITRSANLWGADLFIVFHRNDADGKDTQPNGAECGIAPKASETSKRLAAAVQQELVALGFKDRTSGVGYKVWTTRNYVVTRTTMPATSIECGFVLNPGDNELFDGKFDLIAQGIAAAILSIAGGVVPNTVTPPSPSANVPELNRVLKYGCKGGDVRMMQERLNAHKANVGKADGEFGDKTRRGLHAFQQARIHEGRDVGCRYNGNKPDGKCGELTWAILHEPAPGE